MSIGVIPFDTFEQVGRSLEVEGSPYGNAGLSVILVNFAPGQVVKAHSHPYAEVFVVLTGAATYQIDGESVPVRAGQMVIVPADTVHAFENTGDVPLQQVDVHA